MNAIRRYTENLLDEWNSAELYKALARQEKNPIIADVYNRLSVTEAKHARTWEKKILEAGGSLPIFRASLRTRGLIWLTQRFGVDFRSPSLVSFEKLLPMITQNSRKQQVCWGRNVPMRSCFNN